MRINLISALACVLTSCFSCPAQSIPKDKLFRFPIDEELVLSGTFAEIRTNHFHSGIDISTKETEGKDVMAAAGGYVSRIKVAPDGFGKALYITHPNGYVTVYGHLQRFNDEIEKVVLAEQYKRESFAVEIFPAANQITVKQGEVIAYSGNTGGSSGPHLHFEIRDQKTEEPLNVLDFGFNFIDTTPPLINSLAIYPIGNKGSVDGNCLKKVIPVKKTGKRYSPVDPSEIKVNGNVVFGIETFDKQVSGGSELGIRSMELWIDEKKVYDYNVNRFRFDESKYVNANIDYEERILKGKKIIMCNRQPADNFRELNKNNATVLTSYSTDGKHEAVFKVTDFRGNSSEAILNFKSVTASVPCTAMTENDTTFYVSCKKPFTHRTKDLIIATGKLPFIYDDSYIVISEAGGNKKLFSNIYIIGQPTVPVHNSFNLGIKPEKLPKWLFKRALLVKIDERGNISSAGGEYNGGFVEGPVSAFGSYAVAVDTVPPVIKATNLSTRGERGKIFFRIKISDDLSGIATYRATVNKKWMLMEYDAKTGTLTGQKPIEKKGKYTFDLIVTDKKGNTSKYSAKMSY